jgi:hypothetical protein
MTTGTRVITLETVLRSYYAEYGQLSNEELKLELKNKRSRAYEFSRLFKRYMAAQRTAVKFGYVGVGCITFAEDRLTVFARRSGITV